MPDPALSLLRLGSTLYMPALRPDLAEVGNGSKYPGLRSLIYCTGDSVLERDLPQALDTLAEALPRLEPAAVKRFIRPRNPEILSRLLKFTGMEKISGFVIPKADLRTLPAYCTLLEPQTRFSLMLTLETEAVFDRISLHRLRSFLVHSPLRERITALRIGAQDLLSLMGLRREPGVTIYETPLGFIIDQILTVFRPAGFALAAPVFEYFDDPGLLRRELETDISRGLYGKAALHPAQLEIISAAYKVSREDLEAARAVLDPDRPAVFRLQDRMYEKTVHWRWAQSMKQRAELYGLR
ncbi:MAG: HpcH/HpaI aldolase/citrate lyase family protein [Desulfovibrio sp.]|jgi:citrate lyase beta subunit|nr:HpcH/HpaI aldolase/citrate lyase family protein [Desulfovibrio sp.]